MQNVDFSLLENNEFVFDLPVPFSTARYLKDKEQKVQEIKGQLERIEKIDGTKFPKKIEELKSNLILRLQNILDEECELKLYPIKMKDYSLFGTCVTSLLLEKNNPKLYTDVAEYSKVISMSYLDFLVYKNEQEKDLDWLFVVCSLFSIVFQIKIDSYYCYQENGHYILVLNDKIFISKDDFDTLRKVIVRQNLDYEINDFKNDAQLEAEEVSRIKSKGFKQPSFEDRLTAYCALKHCTKQDAFNCTVRTFNRELSMLIDIKEYEIGQIGVMSGNVMLPKGQTVEHYLYKKDNGGSLEANGFVSYNEMENKIKS